MREETRQEIVVCRDVTVYIADDGTEFKYRGECLTYEWEKFKKPLLEKLQKCDEASGMPNCNGGYVSDCNGYDWYFIRNQEDVDILNDVFGVDISDTHIGEWVCIETDEGCDTWFTPAREGVQYATELLTKLGYKVEITKA